MEQVLQIFKDNAFLGVCAVGVILWLEWLLKGKQSVPARWRKTCQATTVLSLMVGLYWVPAQAPAYAAIGITVAAIAAWLSLRPIDYEAGAGFNNSAKTLPFAKRALALLPALWAPFIIPSLQWLFHDSLPRIFPSPDVADPLMSLASSLAHCTLACLLLIAIIIILDKWRAIRRGLPPVRE